MGFNSGFKGLIKYRDICTLSFIFTTAYNQKLWYNGTWEGSAMLGPHVSAGYIWFQGLHT